MRFIITFFDEVKLFPTLRGNSYSTGLLPFHVPPTLLQSGSSTLGSTIVPKFQTLIHPLCQGPKFYLFIYYYFYICVCVYRDKEINNSINRFHSRGACSSLEHGCGFACRGLSSLTNFIACLEANILTLF